MRWQAERASNGIRFNPLEGGFPIRRQEPLSPDFGIGLSGLRPHPFNRFQEIR